MAGPAFPGGIKEFLSGLLDGLLGGLIGESKKGPLGGDIKWFYMERKDAARLMGAIHVGMNQLIPQCTTLIRVCF